MYSRFRHIAAGEVGDLPPPKRPVSGELLAHEASERVVDAAHSHRDAAITTAITQQ